MSTGPIAKEYGKFDTCFLKAKRKLDLNQRLGKFFTSSKGFKNHCFINGALENYTTTY